MKYPILFVLIFLFFQTLQAQVGVTAGYRNFLSNDWNDAISLAYGADYSTVQGRSVAIDYWFRLKKRRIEFTPELAIGQFSQTVENQERTHDFQSFHFNTNVYLFDLDEDCDCPVWSKDGNFLTKGFFIQVSPGVSRLKSQFGEDSNQNASTKINFEAGIGAGLDIGISDFLTVTPLAKFYFSPNAEWNELYTITVDDGKAEGPYRQFFAGIRLGFRWKK